METKRFTEIDEAFTCVNCGAEVQPLQKSCRNHCPYCLHSLHLDNNPGDRASNCGGILQPISVTVDSRKGFIITHRCKKCGLTKRNKAVTEGVAQPDSLDAILDIMRNS